MSIQVHKAKTVAAPLHRIVFSVKFPRVVFDAKVDESHEEASCEISERDETHLVEIGTDKYPVRPPV